MKNYDTTIITLLRQADAIIEADAGNTYLGFCAPGTTGTDQAKWSISQISTTGDTTTIKWANGQRNYDLVLDDYATFTYTFRKF